MLPYPACPPTPVEGRGARPGLKGQVGAGNAGLKLRRPVASRGSPKGALYLEPGAFELRLAFLVDFGE